MSNRRNLHEQAKDAGARLLARVGYELLDEHPDADWADFVARDGEDVVFVAVDVLEGPENDVPMADKSPECRARAEADAAAWLNTVGEKGDDCPVRFDHLGMLTLGDSRAFTRHTRNAFC